jgi:hypothetical protein
MLDKTEGTKPAEKAQGVHDSTHRNQSVTVRFTLFIGHKGPLGE